MNWFPKDWEVVVVTNQGVRSLGPILAFHTQRGAQKYANEMNNISLRAGHNITYMIGRREHLKRGPYDR